jgi:hypothetical protein
VVEQIVSRPDAVSEWGLPLTWCFTGDKWGNPGILKCAEQLGKANGAPLLDRCKRVVAQVVTQLEVRKKQVNGKEAKWIEEAQAAMDKAIQECEKKLGRD